MFPAQENVPSLKRSGRIGAGGDRTTNTFRSEPQDSTHLGAGFAVAARLMVTGNRKRE